MSDITLGTPGGPQGQGGDNIKDSTDQTFMADVVEASNQQPVLVDFWAPWCGPCKSLGPLLEKVVNDQQGKVKLVKVNIDENPGIAGQLGVRSIPAVFAFDKGRPVDAFQGALPEGQLREFISKLVGGTDQGKQIAEAVERAGELLKAGDTAQAAQIYGAVVEADPQNTEAISGLARCYVSNGDPERAEQILDMAGPEKQNDPDIKRVRTAIELMAEAPQDDELAALEEKVSANPGDHAQRFELADALMKRGQHKPAADHLLTILSDDLNWGEGRAKAKLLEVFEAAGEKDPATIEGRRRLSSLMFA